MREDWERKRLTVDLTTLSPLQVFSASPSLGPGTAVLT